LLHRADILWHCVKIFNAFIFIVNSQASQKLNRSLNVYQEALAKVK